MDYHDYDICNWDQFRQSLMDLLVQAKNAWGYHNLDTYDLIQDGFVTACRSLMQFM